MLSQKLKARNSDIAPSIGFAPGRLCYVIVKDAFFIIAARFASIFILNSRMYITSGGIANITLVLR